MLRMAGSRILCDTLYLSLLGLRFQRHKSGSWQGSIGREQKTQSLEQKLEAILEAEHAGIQIAGMYSPPFGPVSAAEDEEIVRLINEARADFVWVGLGAPKQERWMAEHQGKVKGLMVGVGAGFDYFAGNIKRAPEWMQRGNLEWFFRLLQEPRRLFSRYMKTNWSFVWNAYLRGR